MVIESSVLKGMNSKQKIPKLRPFGDYEGSKLTVHISACSRAIAPLMVKVNPQKDCCFLIFLGFLGEMVKQQLV